MKKSNFYKCISTRDRIRIRNILTSRRFALWIFLLVALSAIIHYNDDPKYFGLASTSMALCYLLFRLYQKRG